MCAGQHPNDEARGDGSHRGGVPWRAGRGRLTLLAAASLLAVHVGLTVDSLRQQWVTTDEFAHLPAGLSYWRTGRFFLYHHNPPLVKLLASLPVLAMNPEYPGGDYRYEPLARPEWGFAKEFQGLNRARYFTYFISARLVIVAMSVAAGIAIFAWSRSLFGPGGGLISLAIWCVSPAAVGYAQFVTPDTGSAAAGVIAAYAFWRFLRTPTAAAAGLAGLALGLAQLTKFTLLVLFPAFAAIALIDRLEGRPRVPLAPGRFAVGRTRGLVLAFGLALLVLNAGYAFEGSGHRVGDFTFTCGALTAPDPLSVARGPYTVAGRVNRFLGSPIDAWPIPLPFHYVTGLDAQKYDNDIGFLNFLDGEIRQGGWGHYYFYALAMRTPLGTLALFAVAAVLLLASSSCRAAMIDELCLALPAVAIFALILAQSGLQYSRYLLPCLPFACIWLGRLGPWCRSGGWPRLALVLAALGWDAGSTLRCHPHEISYFNELAGGPARGHERLLETIDWGQDLTFLKRWLGDHPEAEPIGLAYVGPTDPDVLGIRYALPPQSDDPGPPRGPGSGYYALSVHLLHGFDWFVPDGTGGGVFLPWDAYGYFTEFRPIARAGYSILIYKLTPEELESGRRRWLATGGRPLQTR